MDHQRFNYSRSTPVVSWETVLVTLSWDALHRGEINLIVPQCTLNVIANGLNQVFSCLDMFVRHHEHLADIPNLVTSHDSEITAGAVGSPDIHRVKE